MFKAIESWATMDNDTFQSILEVMLYLGQLGSEIMVSKYSMIVRNLMRSYFAEKNEVRSSPALA